MDISSILPVERIVVPIEAHDKHGVITELIDKLAATAGLTDRDAALQAVLKRESERTTGIGFGLAIPHGKSDGCENLVMAAGKPSAPVDFDSVDGNPVTFVVLLVSPPNQTGAHIQALAKISRLMNMEDFRDQITAAASPEELFAAIEQHEAPAT